MEPDRSWGVVRSPEMEDPRRGEVREWIADHPAPSGRQLAEAGYVAPQWPPPWGLGADPAHQLIIDEELAAAGIKRPDNQIGIGWAGPTILVAGTEAQRQRYLLPLLSGEEIWCQLFSEPGAGSDLAGLTTRAERRRRRVRRQRPEDLDERRPHVRLRHPARPNRPSCAEAPRHLLLHLPDGPARNRGPTDHRHDRQVVVQRGVLHRRSAARRAVSSASSTTGGDWRS